MIPATPTLAQALAQAHTLGLARIDAQLLLLHTLARPDAGRAWLLAHDTDALDEGAHGQFIALCQRRLAGEPVAYLTGRKEFYGLPLQVDARVLDPRPDTETLVDWALEVIAPLSAPRMVDLGTGSGDRSDRIRTYNFPQGRLTDHRINLTLYKLLYVMEGDLGDVLQALQHAREAEQLEELEMGTTG